LPAGSESAARSTVRSTADAASEDGETPPLRVALVEVLGGSGGLAAYGINLGTALAARHAEVTLYTGSVPAVLEAGPGLALKEYFAGVYRGRSRLLKAARYLAALLRTLAHAHRRGAALAHFHFFDASPLEWVTVVLARGFGLRTVVTAHDVESLAAPGRGTCLRAIYRVVDRAVVHSEVARNELAARLERGRPPIAVIPLGHFAPAVEAGPGIRDARAHLGIADAQPVLLFFGQIKRVKGLEVLLAALPELVRVFPRLRLVIAGRPWKTDFSVYAEMIRTLGLEENVLARIGYVPEEEVRTYFAAADLVVLPYRKIYQSAVLSVALSHRRPVLVSDIPGMTEVIRDGVNGFVFADGDPASLARRLREVLADPARMAEVAAEGYRWIRGTQDWEKVGEATLRVYRAAVAREGRRGRRESGPPPAG